MRARFFGFSRLDKAKGKRLRQIGILRQQHGGLAKRSNRLGTLRWRGHCGQAHSIFLQKQAILRGELGRATQPLHPELFLASAECNHSTLIVIRWLLAQRLRLTVSLQSFVVTSTGFGDQRAQSPAFRCERLRVLPMLLGGIQMTECQSDTRQRKTRVDVEFVSRHGGPLSISILRKPSRCQRIGQLPPTLNVTCAGRELEIDYSLPRLLGKRTNTQRTQFIGIGRRVDRQLRNNATTPFRRKRPVKSTTSRRRQLLGELVELRDFQIRGLHVEVNQATQQRFRQFAATPPNIREKGACFCRSIRLQQ